MLVLSRRMGESVVIGDDIVITVLEYRGDVVRIGVEAPRHVQVRRAELLAELAETNRAAASPGEGPEPESGPAPEDARPRPPRLAPPTE